jgi:hypothetical protein
MFVISGNYLVIQMKDQYVIIKRASKYLFISNKQLIKINLNRKLMHENDNADFISKFGFLCWSTRKRMSFLNVSSPL